MTVEEDIKKQMMDMAALILCGLCSRQYTDIDNESIDFCVNAAEGIMKRVNAKVKADSCAVQEKKPASKRESTGFRDARGREIMEGDIFVYDAWIFRGVIPDDFIRNYADKYSKDVCVHPVFWDAQGGMWASDVYGDCDRLGTYDFTKLYVVANKDDFPELYNY